MILKRAGSQPSAKGPAHYFTGTVRIDAPFQATEPGRAAGATVTFESGAPARRRTLILSDKIATADRHCANAHIPAIVRYTAAAEMYALSCRAVTPFRNSNDF
jgi:hypothetical protein